MKNKMMAFTAEVSVGPIGYAYPGVGGDASTNAAVTPQQERSSCGINCYRAYCGIECPVGKAAHCYCYHGHPVCKCV
jgi:hypothetical protein